VQYCWCLLTKAVSSQYSLSRFSIAERTDESLISLLGPSIAALSLHFQSCELCKPIAVYPIAQATIELVLEHLHLTSSASLLTDIAFDALPSRCLFCEAVGALALRLDASLPKWPRLPVRSHVFLCAPCNGFRPLLTAEACGACGDDGVRAALRTTVQCTRREG